MAGGSRGRAGSVFGDGVYLAADLNVALQFTSAATAPLWPRSLLCFPDFWRASDAGGVPDNVTHWLEESAGVLSLPAAERMRLAAPFPFRCVFACQVVDLPHLRSDLPWQRAAAAACATRHTGNQGHQHAYFVVPDPGLIRVTHLLLFFDSLATTRARQVRRRHGSATRQPSATRCRLGWGVPVVVVLCWLLLLLRSWSSVR